MIALAIIAAVTVITCTSLHVANAIDKRMTPPPEPEPVDHRKEAIEQKRAVLERQRRECGATMTGNRKLSDKQRMVHDDEIKKVDAQLLALADEEAKL